MASWKTCKNILCIRPDNMGDVIMSGPAIRALKRTFKSSITLLTSTAGTPITAFMPEIDGVITCDLPWVKADQSAGPSAIIDLVNRLKLQKFDAAIIFTVYSQNPLPSAMVAYLADIPLRLAYCRENPYQLLTDWLPDKQPYSNMSHQVTRDLDLVKHIGAKSDDVHLSLTEPSPDAAQDILKMPGLAGREYIVIHPSVSEEKRQFPFELWVETLRELRKVSDASFVMTGGESGRQLVAKLIEKSNVERCYNLAGGTDLPAFISLINGAQLLLSVNTSSIHIAAAMRTPVVVLYAGTNPQHTPWMVSNRIFYFPVPESLRSQNEVVRYGMQAYFDPDLPYPEPAEIAAACKDVLSNTGKQFSATAHGA